MTKAVFYRPDSREMVVRWRKGRSVVAWELKDSKHKRNEPLDLRNYATAALEIANPILQEGEIAKPIRKRSGGPPEARRDLIGSLYERSVPKETEHMAGGGGGHRHRPELSDRQPYADASWL